MARRPFPKLDQGAPLYVEHTLRARIHNPGIERYRPDRSRRRRQFLLVLAVVALAVTAAYAILF
jgi:hypothetical protein